MSENIKMGRFLNRRAKAAEWVLSSAILGEGEIGLELDTGLFKFGNGRSLWKDLPYANNQNSGEGGGGSGEDNPIVNSNDLFIWLINAETLESAASYDELLAAYVDEKYIIINLSGMYVCPL